MLSLDDLVHHNEVFVRQMGKLRLFVSAEATLVILTKVGFYQLAQFGFSRDGSFRIAWPYFHIHEGIVADVTFPAPEAGQMTISLTEKGRFTSQLVKFSHHPGGLALFTQTGRVVSKVRRNSFSLTGPIGRLFHI